MPRTGNLACRRRAVSPGFDAGQSHLDTESDIDCSAVETSLTWWHAPADADAPLPAARRLLRKIPQAELRLFDDDEGHLAAFHRESDILDELLTRG